jgi:hypothetical integral membrane protein (TIGR02206 family)
VRQFSPAHLAALAVLTAACTASIIVPRRHPGDWVRWPAWVLAGVIVAGWVGEYIAEVIVGTWSLGYSLPLQLTDAVSLAAILALVTRRRLFIDLVFFWAFSGSLQAALTPDLGRGQSFPSVFYFTYFTYHVGAIVAACLLVLGCRLYPPHDAIWRVYGLTLCWAALAGLGDLITGGNYMYLRSKPVHHSLLNVMGPWPWYIAAAAALALLIFLALRALLEAVRRLDVGHRRS